MGHPKRNASGHVCKSDIPNGGVLTVVVDVLYGNLSIHCHEVEKASGDSSRNWLTAKKEDKDGYNNLERF